MIMNGHTLYTTNGHIMNGHILTMQDYEWTHTLYYEWTHTNYEWTHDYEWTHTLG